MKSLPVFYILSLFLMSFSVKESLAQSYGGEGSGSNIGAAGQISPAPSASSPAASTTETKKMRRAGVTMIATGWPVFGGTWLFMTIVGVSMLSASVGCDSDGYCDRTRTKDAWLIAPLFGPLVTASMEMSEYGADLWWAWLEIFSSILQIGGLAVAIAGHVMYSKAKASGKGTVKGGASLRVIPMFHASSRVVGLSLAFRL